MNIICNDEHNNKRGKKNLTNIDAYEGGSTIWIPTHSVKEHKTVDQLFLYCSFSRAIWLGLDLTIRTSNVENIFPEDVIVKMDTR